MPGLNACDLHCRLKPDIRCHAWYYVQKLAERVHCGALAGYAFRRGMSHWWVRIGSRPWERLLP